MASRVRASSERYASEACMSLEDDVVITRRLPILGAAKGANESRLSSDTEV